MIYNKIAKNYDKFLEPLEIRFLSNWRRETLECLPEGTSVLEIGVGTGLNFRFYPQARFAVACEISFEMIHQARKKNDTCLLIQADAENLPFASDSFDTAFATLVFCSISNPRKALEELKRVVKNDGTIALLEHVRPNGFLGYLFDFLNLFTERLLGDCFNRQTTDLLTQTGFEVIALKRKALGIINLIICKNRKFC